jgi:hypothetical protein
MDIGKALSFVFEDEEWISKVLLGAVIMLIPIFGQFALLGYGIAIIRNVKAGDPRPLPAWSNLGDLFIDGLKFWVATLIYAIPFIIFLCPIMLVWVLPALGAENEDLAAILAGVSGIVSMALGCLAVLYGILLSLLTPVIQIRYAETGEIGPCLAVGEVFRLLLDNLGSVLIAVVLGWVVSTVVLSTAGTLTLGLLALPGSVWLKALSCHMYGQIGQQVESTPTAI